MDNFLTSFQASCLLFLASISLVLRRHSKCHAALLSVKKTVVGPTILPHTSVLVELAYPGDKELLRLKNDIILSKVIDGNPKRYFLSIVGAQAAPAYGVGAYIADLYSKAWNEAAIKKCFDLDCVVLCDAIPNILSARDVLQREDVTEVYTYRPDMVTQFLPAASHRKVMDTASITSPLDKGVLDNARVQFLDSHFQADLQQFPSYQYVAVGGSFDNLHNGHRKLLMFAATLCTEEMTIGVTNDTMLASKSNAKFIGSYEERVQSVRNYLREIKPNLSLNIVKLNEPYGPAITDPRLQVLVVSSETILGAFKINDIRRAKDFSPLDIVVLNRVDAAILSSSFIREQKAMLSAV